MRSLALSLFSPNRSLTLAFLLYSSIRFSPEVFKKFYANYADYTPKLALRSQQVANSPEIIRRLGVIAMSTSRSTLQRLRRLTCCFERTDTPVEVDMYAHVNSTMTLGSKMLNGLGGSGDFLRNAKLSIVHAPSSRPSKTDPTGISSIVPFVSHIDQYV